MISAKIEQLIEQLDKLNPGATLDAVESLVKIGRPAVPALVEALNVHENGVRWYAASALGRINDHAAIAALIEALRNDEDYKVREVAAQGLGNAWHRSVVSALHESLRHDRDYHVRNAAAISLAEVGDQSTLPVLIDVLSGPDHEVRSSVAHVLGTLRNPAGAPALILALKDEDNEVRAVAADSLGKIGSSSAVPALLTALEDESFQVRISAANALMKTDIAASHPAIPVFIEGLLHGFGFQNTLLDAGLALKQLGGDSTTVPRMILAASRLSAADRNMALHALRDLDKPTRPFGTLSTYTRYPAKQEKYRDLRFDFPDTRTLCRLVLNEGDAAASTGAQEVLNFLDAFDLVRASERDVSTEAQELLRAPQGTGVDTHAETLLVPADAPDEDVKPRPSIWHWLFGTRKDS
jgi:HEAT repeat protein